VRKADNLPQSRAVVMKSGNLNFLEPPGPLQACNGTALPVFPEQATHAKIARVFYFYLTMSLERE